MAEPIKNFSPNFDNKYFDTETQAISEAEQAEQDPKCNPHPDAPHGFDRNASHNMGRYVCECEGWEPEQANHIREANEMVQAEQKPVAWMHIPKYYIGDKVRPVVSIIKYDEPEVYAYTFPLYYQPTAPQREWVSLTDDEIRWVENTTRSRSYEVHARAIEAKLKEKNCG